MIDNIFLGIQGWRHAEWVGCWYPADIRSDAMLGDYSQRFPTVEVDDTFYGIPPEPLVRTWRQTVPPSFTFALKTPQQITHELRFTAGQRLLKRFLERVSLLEGRLGPLLLLAPPAFKPDDANRAALNRFVNALPTDFRWALEFRQKAWFTEDIFDLLRKRNVAAVIGENRWVSRSSMLNTVMTPTADFAYVRWNSRNADEPSRVRLDHKEDATAFWAEAVEQLTGTVDTLFGYFHVKAFGDGLRSASALMQATGLRPIEEPVSEEAPTHGPAEWDQKRRTDA